MRIPQKSHEFSAVFGTCRGERFATNQHAPEQKPLDLLAVAALGMGVVPAGAKPGVDRFVVVAGRQRAAARVAVIAVATIERGGRGKALQRGDAGGLRGRGQGARMRCLRRGSRVRQVRAERACWHHRSR